MTRKTKVFEARIDEPNARVRFLTTPDIHFSLFDKTSDLQESIDKIRSTLNESKVNPFEPFPFASLYPFEQLGAMRKIRSLVNAVTVKTKQLPFSKRKKKSWLRYTSNKKWNRKFTPQFIRVVNGPTKVLSLSPALFAKLKQLSKITKTTGPGAGAGVLYGRTRG